MDYVRLESSVVDLSKPSTSSKRFDPNKKHGVEINNFLLYLSCFIIKKEKEKKKSKLS